MSYEVRFDFAYEEEQTIKKIGGYLNTAENELYTLTHLKRATKKDGTPFQRLGDNYPGAKVTVVRSYSGYVSSVEISGSIGKYLNSYSNYVKITLYVLNSDQEDVSFEDVEKMIRNYIERQQEHVKTYKAQLKAVRKAYTKISKEALRLHNAIRGIPECVDGSYFTSLGHDIVAYAKKCIY